MMESKHTPGEWVNEPELATSTSRQVSSFSRGGNRVLQIVVTSFNPEEDAFLISAAPDLLAALRPFAENPDDWDVDTVNAALAAISKAEGRT